MNLPNIARLLVLSLPLLAAFQALAQTRALEPRAAAAPAASDRRVALVIGNAKYADSPLANPVNDANDTAAALKALGFEVIVRTDANQKLMKQAIREFGGELKKGGVGVFYYAGHGIQSKGRNYLVPVGQAIGSEAELEDEAVDLNLVLNFMEEAKNRINIVVLDACRNNPFARSFRSGTRGLAQVDAGKGTLIAFATSPGSVAFDGTGGRNGVYTKHFLDTLRQQDTDVEKVFKRVRMQVYQETGGKQIPWESSSLIGDFSFQSRGAAAAPKAAVAAPAIDPAAFELALWNEIRDRSNPNELRAYLEQYPNGRFSKVARERIANAETPPPAPQTEANRMLGTWNGQYGYNEMRRPNVNFKLTITGVDGNRFSGMISEPATFGDGTSRFLFAGVRGTVKGGIVSFVKTYDGTGGQTHSVNYQGTLEPASRAINGGWTIVVGGRTNATGFFDARQN